MRRGNVWSKDIIGGQAAFWPSQERQELARLAGRAGAVWAVADSDMLATAQYGRSRLVLCEREVFVEEGGAVRNRIPLDQIASVYCRDFVGNGLLEVKTKDGHRHEVIRYSKTTAESFQQIAERLNRRLHVSEEALRAQEEEVAKTSGPREASGTYRCPNCGYPLNYPSDACPRCASKRDMVVRLARLMRGHWRLALVGLLLSVAFTLSNLGPGYLVKQLIDKSLKPDPPDVPLAVRQVRLVVIAGILVGLLAMRMLTAHFRIKVMGTLGVRVVADLRTRLYRALQRLSLSYYDREHTGRIMSRVLTDTRMVQRFVTQGLQQVGHAVRNALAPGGAGAPAHPCRCADRPSILETIPFHIPLGPPQVRHALSHGGRDHLGDASGQVVRPGRA